MTPEYEALLAVQELDTSIAQARHRQAHLPEAAAVAAIDADRERIEVQLRDARAARDAVVERQTAMERDLAAAEQRADEVSKRMYSGTVSASRDLQAMAADIELQKSRASDLEDRLLELFDEREPLDAVVDALTEELASLASRRVVAAEALAEAEANVASEVTGLQQQRAERAAAVPPDLLAAYGRVGAARLVGSRCDGCHLTLPATEMDRIRHDPPEAVVYCDQCGRILIRP